MKRSSCRQQLQNQLWNCRRFLSEHDEAGTILLRVAHSLVAEQTFCRISCLQNRWIIANTDGRCQYPAFHLTARPHQQTAQPAIGAAFCEPSSSVLCSLLASAEGLRDSSAMCIMQERQEHSRRGHRSPHRDRSRERRSDHADKVRLFRLLEIVPAIACLMRVGLCRLMIDQSAAFEHL